MKFFRFAPEGTCGCFVGRRRFGDHTEPVFGFFGLLAADRDFVAEVAFRLRFVGFAIVGANARAGADELVDNAFEKEANSPSIY